MYSTSEAAEKMGLSQDHVRLLARTGVIEAKKLGHDWVVLNLDYKRKRRLKGTSYVSLTPSGRQAITILGQQGRDDEAEVLRFLIRGGATVQQISDETYIQSSTVRLYLRQFKKENWIKVKKAEEESLEEHRPEEVSPEEKSRDEDGSEEIALEEESRQVDKIEEISPEEESRQVDKIEEISPEEESRQIDKIEEISLEEESHQIDKPEEVNPEEEKSRGTLLVYDF